MNIQIFGKSKCFDSRTAERFFKERGTRYQFINVLEKGMSARELDSVISSLGDIDQLFDGKSKAYQDLNVAYIKRSLEDKKQLLMDNPSLIKTPIVRDCDTKKCTIGVAQQTWKGWQ